MLENKIWQTKLVINLVKISIKLITKFNWPFFVLELTLNSKWQQSNECLIKLL